MNQHRTQNQHEDIEQNQQHQTSLPDVSRINPRWVFTDPEAFFGRDQYFELLMEQHEQM